MKDFHVFNAFFNAKVSVSEFLVQNSQIIIYRNGFVGTYKICSLQHPDC